MIVEDYIEVNQQYEVYPYINRDGADDTDLTSATLQIKAVDPEGNINLLSATETTYNNRQVLQATVTSAINDTVGIWIFQTWITFSGHTNATPGKPYEVEVNDTIGS
jgi:hypothetical protein